MSPRSDQCRLPLADLASADVERVIAHGLELALVVARLSPQLRPPVPVPKGLRPLVQFAKLPASARPAVRRVLEEDEEFRGRVAVITDEAGAPRAAWLFLHRPDGWADELAALVREAVGAGEASEAGRAERGLQRRLTGAETALARADEALAAARKEGVRAAEELAGERRARRSVEEHRDALTQRLGALEEERDAAGRRAGCVEVDSADLRRQLGAARAGVVSAEGARERAERQAAAEAGVPGRSRPPPHARAIVRQLWRAPSPMLQQLPWRWVARSAQPLLRWATRLLARAPSACPAWFPSASPRALAAR